MAIVIYVSCSRKQTSESGAAQITHIGGEYRDGSSWVLTEKVAIAAIECKAIEFRYRRDGHIYGLSVATGPKGHKWLCGGGYEGLDYLFYLPDCADPS